MSSFQSYISIFCDFDGTITLKDVGNEFFNKFCDISPLNRDLKAGKISIKEYWQLLAKEIPNNLDEKDFNSIANDFEIDPNFQNFYSYIKKEGYQFTILSDGYQEYIQPILKQNNLEELKFFSNKLIKLSNGEFKPIYNYANDSCNCFSASCKRNKLLELLAESEVLVYIGDGYSDFCPAEHCDIIFAKGDLEKYCQKNRIPHHGFRSFFDVQYILSTLKTKNRLKRRHQAYTKREKAFIYE